MAVILEATIKRFIGASTDDKPEDVPAGSLFTEFTAGAPPSVRRWVFDGTAWGLEVDTGGGDVVVDINLLVPRTVVDEAVLDEGEADWTGATDLIAIAPAEDSPLREATLYIDLDKAATGFATTHTTEELTLTVLRKVDGTNWRVTQTLAAVAANAADAVALTIPLGTVGDDEEVKITATLSAEADGSTVVELPFVLHYLAAEAPTITAAEAGA